MAKQFLFIISVFLLTSFNSSTGENTAVKLLSTSIPAAEAEAEKELINTLYGELDLSSKGLDFKAFEYAITGLRKLEARGVTLEKSLLTIVDFSQPSTQKRLYIVDLENKELVFQTYVAHGRNSGAEMATRFSNKISSYQSSLGFYKTANTYHGKHGFSLRLEGLEPGINSNAFKRAIVMHAADYVSESTIQSLGYLGRSLGCPAIAKEFNRPIINLIKDGSLLFIYHPTEQYVKNSAILS